MGSYAATSHTTWIGGYDWTGDLNQLTAGFTWEPLDNTPYGSTGRRRIGGLESAHASLAGWHDLAEGRQDENAWTGLGTTTEVVTHSVDGTEGSVAYAYQARKFSYQMFGKVGEVAPFTLDIAGSRASGASQSAVRGQVAVAKQDVSATGAVGSGLNLGAVLDTQFVFCALHIFTAGTTVTLLLESDDNSGFTSPTTVATIGPLTAAGGTWMTRVAGPLTDTYWRLNVSAITGTFTLGAMIAVDRNP